MSSKEAKEIKLTRLLKEKFINLDLKGLDKKEVIAELVGLIAKSKKLTNKKGFLKAIQEREKLGSTGIGAGVAIPHAKSDAIRDFILVFARSDKGIDFGALDGEKTFLFFALASPKNEIGGHLKILAEIAHLVKDKFLTELLRKAKDGHEVLKIITRMEGR
jgi:fructose-specific phosphotransferase system IIA component